MRNSKEKHGHASRIMGHCHLFPGGFGPQSRDCFGIPGTSEHLVGLLKRTGFEAASVLAPTENPADPIVKACIRGNMDGLEWLLSQPEVGSAETLIPAATIRPNILQAVEKLRHARSLGVRMLKFHPIIMQIDPTAAECRDFFAEASALRLPLVYHTGGGSWIGNSEPARPIVCAKLAESYPSLNILMAHCGVFGKVDEFETAVDLCVKHDNLFMDTTACLLRVGKDRWKKALDRVGAGRIVYGTDYPWIAPVEVEQELAFIDSLGVTEAEKDLILGGNLKSLWDRAQ